MRRLLSRYLIIWLLFCMLALLGCERHETRLAGLKIYIEDVKHRPSQVIGSMPQWRSFGSFGNFVGKNRRDPFQPSQARGMRRGPDGIKATLAVFSLDALTMVGSLEQADSVWAIIAAPDGSVHKVKAGDCIGQNFSRVDEVSSTQITLVETVPDGLGGWEKKHTVVALK